MIEWSLFISKEELFNITVIQVYAPSSNAEEAEVEQFYEDLQDLLELTPQKDVLFVIRDWNAKVRSEKIPGVIDKFGLGVQNEAGQRLTEFCQEKVLVIANTLFQQHKRRLYTWTSPDGQYQNHIVYILCSQRWRSSIQSAKTRPGADCGSDHELLIAKHRLKLEKAGKTTRPFRYDLNQIPYDYTVHFSSVTQSCLTLFDPMDVSMPGLPVHHHLPEFTQTHVHWVGAAILPSHPLPSPSPPAFNLSQHQGLFNWVSSSHQVVKVLEFQLQHQSF